MNKLAIAALVCVLASCRPVVNLEDPDNYWNMADRGSTTWGQVFEGFWTGMNTNYVFWDVDPTDWDVVYDTYKPKFEALGTVGENPDPATVDIVRDYFSEMLKNIVDSHYYLSSSSLIDSDGNSLLIDPSSNRYRNQYESDDAFYRSEHQAERSWKRDWNMGGAVVGNTEFIAAVQSEIDHDYCGFSMQNTPFYAATGYARQNGGAVLYFYFSNFMWSNIFRNFDAHFPDGDEDAAYRAIDEALSVYGGAAATVREVLDPLDPAYSGDLDLLTGYLETSPGSLKPDAEAWEEAIMARCPIDHLNYFFDQLEQRSLEDGTPVIGAVIDIRGNGGGYNEDLSSLWGRIVPHDWVYAKLKFKSGENRLDYSPLMDSRIYKMPGTGAGVTDIPLALVVNKSSVSASELTTLLFKTLPNGYVIGGVTWGGMGTLSDTGPYLYNGGQFSVGGATIEMVYTPFRQNLTLQGESLEGKGVAPDYPVPFVYDNMMSGVDDRLRKALSVISEQR